MGRQWNGDADGYHLSFLAAAGAATTGNYGDRAFADGQWKCVQPANHLLPGTLHQLLVTMVAEA